MSRKPTGTLRRGWTTGACATAAAKAAWTAVLSSFLLFPLFVHQVNAFIPIGAAALGVGLYTFSHPGLRRGNGDEEEDEPHLGIPADADGAERLSEVVRFPS